MTEEEKTKGEARLLVATQVAPESVVRQELAYRSADGQFGAFYSYKLRFAEAGFAYAYSDMQPTVDALVAKVRELVGKFGSVQELARFCMLSFPEMRAYEKQRGWAS